MIDQATHPVAGCNDFRSPGAKLDYEHGTGSKRTHCRSNPASLRGANSHDPSPAGFQVNSVS